MILFPKAKINIGLHITEKRSDGYHNLQSIFYPIGLSDALEFVEAGEKISRDELTTSGISIDCPPEKNLVMKALSIMREYHKIPVLRIHLHKAIPSGAGLGGGSSDAAALVKGLNRFFKLELNNKKLKEIALNIGSDCPFFIDGTPSYAEGRGEITRPVNPLQEDLTLMLIKPDIDIDTREAYGDCQPVKSNEDLTLYYNLDISEWKEKIRNDFEKTIFLKHPEIGKIKEGLYRAGALYSSMSGSGSAVYGIFRERPDTSKLTEHNIVYSGSL